MKYKIGDKVLIKSLDWYNENKDENREIKFENGIFTTLKSIFLGQIMTIEEITLEKQYILMEDQYKTLWTDEMIEGLVEKETKFGTASNPLETKSNANCLTREKVDALATKIDKELPSGNQYVWELPDGYQFTDENGNVINAQKIVLEKKKKEYPKTYEECCKILNIAVYDLDVLENMLDTSEIIYRKNLDRLLNSFRKLLICRDAYWKLYGEENGLGKPWEPDWKDEHKGKWVITLDLGHIVTGCVFSKNHILTFPTEEMRNAFYEYFKEEIEQCKELL